MFYDRNIELQQFRRNVPQNTEAPIKRRCRCRRNDAIKHVREAADIALQRLEGDEAKEAINMTAVLSEEMKRLKEM